MKFSTKAEYGLRALVNLAGKKGYYSLAQIAKEERISLAYLERLFAKLKKAKIIASQKGVNGGYRLAKPSKAITVKDIFMALEGNLTPYKCNCFDFSQICKTSKCACQIKSVWRKLDDQINKTLESIKLKNLIN
jgi:Rrf2 family protein